MAATSQLGSTQEIYDLAIADSGASDHYLTKSGASQCTNVKSTIFGPRVTAANGDTITAKQSATLPYPTSLSPTTRE